MPGIPLPVIRAGEDRPGAPFPFLNGSFHVNVTSADTSGRLLIIDTFREVSGGPPLHVHYDVDEWFCVLDGRFRFRFRIGGVERVLGPGDAVLGPREVEHAFANPSPQGRFLIVFLPAGTMEDFIRDPSERWPLTPQQFAELSVRNRMTLTGPPLPLD